MKYGAPGYVDPEAGSLPALEEMIGMVREAGGLPTSTWLDGTSSGERSAGELLDFMLAKGAVINNFIPERNWNLPDPGEKQKKVDLLRTCIEACREREMPVIAGTEMNKHGQPFVDSFTSPALAPFAGDFLNGGGPLNQMGFAHC
jgi:sugar phosphate isomerase/epimerase